MSVCTSNKSRSAMLAACLSSLAVTAACDNSHSQAPTFAADTNVSANRDSLRLDQGVPPAWYTSKAPIIRYRFDEKRNQAWILAWDGVHAYDPDTRQTRGRVVLPGWSWVGEPYGCSPELAIGPQGEAIITSDVYPVVWRVDPKNSGRNPNRPSNQSRHRRRSRLFWSGLCAGARCVHRHQFVHGHVVAHRHFASKRANNCVVIVSAESL